MSLQINHEPILHPSNQKFNRMAYSTQGGGSAHELFTGS